MTNIITHHRDGFLSLCWFWHCLLLQGLFAPKLLHCFPRMLGLMNKQLFSQTQPLQIFYLEKSIKGLRHHMLQTLVQEQLSGVREGKPVLFVWSPGPSKQATPPPLVLTSRLSWERLYFRVCPNHPQALNCSCFFVIRKTPGQKQCPVWAVLGLVFWLYVPRWCMQGYVTLLSHNCFPGLSLCGTGVLHCNSFFTPRPVRG